MASPEGAGRVPKRAKRNHTGFVKMPVIQGKTTTKRRNKISLDKPRMEAAATAVLLLQPKKAGF